MHGKSGSLSRKLHIIWAITSKDLLDALKNKTTLSVLLPAIFILVFYRFIPQISGHDDLITVYVYDPTQSEAVTRLEDSIDLDVREVRSKEAVIRAVSNGDVPEIGFSLPPDFSLEADAPLELQGYMLYWISDAERIAAARTVEYELSYLLERPVDLEVDGNVVYHDIESDGLGFLASLSIVFVLVMIGISFLPNLMLEEHKEETMQVLQVSPASALDIITSKALTGLFYSLLASLFAWILYRPLFLHPGLSAGVFILGSLLFISIGLFLGSLVKTRQQLMMVAWIIILPLLIPPFLEIMDDILPQTFLAAIRYLPGVALARILRAGFSSGPDLGFYFGQMLYLLTITVCMFGLSALVIKRRDR